LGGSSCEPLKAYSQACVQGELSTPAPCTQSSQCSSQPHPTSAAPPVAMHHWAAQPSGPCGQHLGDRKLPCLGGATARVF